MKPKDFYLIVEGYNKRLADEHEIGRRLAYFVYAPHSSESLTYESFARKYWPLHTDVFNDDDKLKRLKERLEKLKNGSRATSDRDKG